MNKLQIPTMLFCIQNDNSSTGFKSDLNVIFRKFLQNLTPDKFIFQTIQNNTQTVTIVKINIKIPSTKNLLTLSLIVR